MPLAPIDQLAKHLKKDVQKVAADGMSREVITWIDQGNRRVEIDGCHIVDGPSLVWLETRFQGETAATMEQSFHLKMASGDDVIWCWEVECDNPAFGCRVSLLRWFGEKLLFLYREKHYFYACLFDRTGLVRRVRCGHEVNYTNEILMFHDWSEKERVVVLSLPDLYWQGDRSAQDVVTAEWES